MAVLGEEPLIGGRAESRIVNEDVQPFIVTKDRLRKLANLCEGSEIGGVESGATRTVALDFLDEGHPPLTIAPVNDDMCTTRSDPASNLPAKTARGARDEDNLLARSGSGGRLRFGRGSQQRDTGQDGQSHS